MFNPKIRKATSILLLALAPCVATSSNPQVDTEVFRATNTAKILERGFARAMGVLDPVTGYQPSALFGSILFPGDVFKPPSRQGLNWSYTGLDVETARLCVTVSVLNTESWAKAVQGLSAAGLKAADSSCQPLNSPTFLPSGQFPALVAGFKLVDRRNIPVPTQLPAYPPIHGVQTESRTLPGLIVKAGESKSIIVTNPSIGGLVILSAVFLRDGFSATNNCQLVLPLGSCTIDVQYNGNQGNKRVGSLRLEFNNGAHAVIGLLGLERS